MGVHILGSCVTRDIFNLDKFSDELSSYTARSSLISLTHPAAQDLPIDLSNISSAFQRRMVEHDITSSFFNHIKLGKADVLIIDFIDERFNILQVNNSKSFITISNELSASKFPYTNYGRVILNKSSEYLQLWKKSWDKAVEEFKKLGILDRVFINKVYWASLLDNGSPIPKFSQEAIDFANIRLSKMYDYVSKDIPDNNFIIPPEKYLLSTIEHRWGASPYHYIDSYYRYVAQEIETILYPHYSNGLLFLQGESYKNIEFKLSKPFTLTQSPKIFKLDRPSKNFLLDVKYFAPSGSIKKEKPAIIYFEIQGANPSKASELSVYYSENENIRWFKYLDLEEGQGSTQIAFTLPEKATVNKFALSTWMGAESDKILITELNINQ